MGYCWYSCWCGLFRFRIGIVCVMSKNILYSVYKTHPEWDLDRDYYGPAITTSYEQDGVIYVTNGEYLTQVNYCPFTGKKGAVTPEYNREDTFYKQLSFWEWG